MNTKVTNSFLACMDFFFCGVYYTQGDTKKALLFGSLGFILWVSSLWS